MNFLISNYGQPCQKQEIHHMVKLRSQNKITDILMILAWASLFNITKVQLLLLLGLLLCPS